ncbi:MAG: O-antigen ligase family protein [Chloroflexota bacterium]
MFWVWLVALSFAQGLYNKNLHPAWRLVLVGLAGATLYVGFFQSRDWVSGWLPPMVAAAVGLCLGRPRLGLTVALACGTALMLSSDMVGGLIGSVETENAYSLTTRLAAWQIVGEITKFSPILGLGPANYYHYTPLFPIMGWYVNFNSHNNYVDIVAQTGLLGLACFLWFVSQLARLGLRLRTRVSDGFCQAYVYGALGGLAGTLVAGMLADWILPFVYNIGLSGFRQSVLAWVFLGGMAALGQNARE